MGKIIGIVVVVALGIVGYYVFKNKGDINKAVDDIKKGGGEAVGEVTGYPAAKTPKEAADLFSNAIKERKYSTAAKYCTGPYAEELKSVNDGAKKLGTAIDDLSYRMSEKSVMNDEMRVVLFFFDPFPKDFTITVEKPTDTEAVGVITPPAPKLTNHQAKFDTTWNVDRTFFNALYPMVNDAPVTKVKIKKEGEEWKLEFPDPASLQKTVLRLKDRANYYAGRLDVLATELKRDAESQSDFKARLKKELEDAKGTTN